MLNTRIILDDPSTKFDKYLGPYILQLSSKVPSFLYVNNNSSILMLLYLGLTGDGGYSCLLEWRLEMRARDLSNGVFLESSGLVTVF